MPAQSIESGGESDTEIGCPRLLARVHEAIRVLHYSPRTEEAYWYWIRYFIRFHGMRHPESLGAAEVTAFLGWLATERDVAAATQNQALSALLFLYGQVLGQELPWLEGIAHAKRPVRLPVVLTHAEVGRLLGALRGVPWLMCALLYGSGLRQIECLSLRVKDVNFAYCQILVRGGKDGVTMLPHNLVEPLRAQFGRVRLLHRRDLAEGHGEAWLPHALARKYRRAGFDSSRRFVFPSGKRSADPESGVIRRHHVHPDTLERFISVAD